MAKRKTHVLTIDQWHPTTLNRLLGCHWANAYRRKKADQKIVAAMAKAQKVPRAIGKRRVSLTITLCPRQRSPDKDAWWKSLLDALVACGLLKDDSPRWCDLGTVEYERGKQRCTTVVLEDAT
jgi:Holliday junction resolvase RusA-like endonuclease